MSLKRLYLATMLVVAITTAPALAAVPPSTSATLANAQPIPPDFSQNGLDDPALYNNNFQYDQYGTENYDPDEAAAIKQWEALDGELKLRRYDKLALELQKEYAEAKAAANPFMGQQGVVIFPYGQAIPRITCRPFRVTSIALQPGEEILGIHAGDTTRWSFEPSTSVVRGQEVKHIIIKPSVAGISTNLMINTNRRSYNIDLTTTDKDNYLPSIGFSYTDSAGSDLNETFGARRSVSSLKSSLDKITAGIENLYTRYTVKASSKLIDWVPLAVFDDGQKTYINMPGNVTEVPALYIHLDGKDTLVNYRVQNGHYYVVDRLFDKAYLRLGSKRVALLRLDRVATSVKR